MVQRCREHTFRSHYYQSKKRIIYMYIYLIRDEHVYFLSCRDGVVSGHILVLSVFKQVVLCEDFCECCKQGLSQAF